MQVSEQVYRKVVHCHVTLALQVLAIPRESHLSLHVFFCDGHHHALSEMGQSLAEMFKFVLLMIFDQDFINLCFLNLKMNIFCNALPLLLYHRGKRRRWDERKKQNDAANRKRGSGNDSEMYIEDF